MYGINNQIQLKKQKLILLLHTSKVFRHQPPSGLNPKHQHDCLDVFLAFWMAFGEKVGKVLR